MTQEEYYDKPMTLFHSFPNFDDSALGCLSLWPSFESQTGTFYIDLLGTASTDPLVPSIINKDKSLVLCAKLRSLLAHALILQYTGAFEGQDYELQTANNSMVKFAELYPEYCATIIQRWWRSKRSKGKEQVKAKLAFNTLMIARPSNALTPDERAIRQQTIQVMLSNQAEQ